VVSDEALHGMRDGPLGRRQVTVDAVAMGLLQVFDDEPGVPDPLAVVFDEEQLTLGPFEGY
jgi:hypothetical protein